MKPLRLARGLVRAPLSGSIRARVVALGLLAAIPAVLMAGIIAGQDFLGRERVAVEHVDRLQGLAISQIDVTIAVAGAALAEMAGRLPATPDCQELVATEFAQMARSSPAIALFEQSGALACYEGARTGLRSAGAGGSPWFRQAQAGADPAVGLTEPDGLTVVAVAAGGGRVLASLLPSDWFEMAGSLDLDPLEAATWLVDGTGRFISAKGAATQALPPVAVMLELQRSMDETRLAKSAGGVPYAYAATRIFDDWRVITAYRATREHAKALRSLYVRLLDLAALLLFGLGVTVFGADIAFGGPLRRLRQALAAWQRGAAFNPVGLAGAPNELLELTESFTEATVSLRQQKAELAEARERQDLLMLEVHHRVKNNLQIVASLLNLQASRIRVPEARAEFQSARDRVRALATLHRHLYSEGDIHTINMRSFLGELCGQLFQAMGETEGDRISLVIVAEEVRLSTDQAVPLALIVTEAVTNAIKYAFPDGRHGSVRVELAEHGATLDLAIADDGVGMPAGPTQTEAGIRDGIGLQLIRGFSRQLGATLEVGEGPGTHYSVRMPLAPSRGAGAGNGPADPA